MGMNSNNQINSRTNSAAMDLQKDLLNIHVAEAAALNEESIIQEYRYFEAGGEDSCICLGPFYLV